jgi:hypothetical protein
MGVTNVNADPAVSGATPSVPLIISDSGTGLWASASSTSADAKFSCGSAFVASSCAEAVDEDETLEDAAAFPEDEAVEDFAAPDEASLAEELAAVEAVDEVTAVVEDEGAGISSSPYALSEANARTASRQAIAAHTTTVIRLSLAIFATVLP